MANNGGYWGVPCMSQHTMKAWLDYLGAMLHVS